MKKMTQNELRPPSHSYSEIALRFLKLGALAYGGPAIMGMMQTELQEKRQWLSKPRFIEGLSLVNMLPGAGATQLGIFLGYVRAGWWGGLLAGLCFVLPAFLIMLALTYAYVAYGEVPLLRSALYGLGPVVLAIFAVAVLRLGRNVMASSLAGGIALVAALLISTDVLGVASVLALAGALGVSAFYSRRIGLVLLVLFGAFVLGTQFAAPLIGTQISANPSGTGLIEIGGFFFKVGALSFGGGLTMIAFIQDQVVNQLHWLSPREFIDGLALGQLTPGPILMVAAFVGYKLAGIAGALVACAAIFLPSFMLMLSIMPIYERVRSLRWMKAALQGIGPAVIGALVASLLDMAPHAVPDLFAGVVFVMALFALLAWRVGVLSAMLGGAGLAVLRERMLALPGLRAFF